MLASPLGMDLAKLVQIDQLIGHSYHPTMQFRETISKAWATIQNQVRGQTHSKMKKRLILCPQNANWRIVFSNLCTLVSIKNSKE